MSYRPVTSSARLVRRLGLAAAATILLSSHAQAGTFDIGDEPSRRLSLSGLLDVRYAHTSQTLGWLSGGVNRLRYGGKDTDNNASGDRDAHVFAGKINGAAARVVARFKNSRRVVLPRIDVNPPVRAFSDTDRRFYATDLPVLQSSNRRCRSEGRVRSAPYRNRPRHRTSLVQSTDASSSGNEGRDQENAASAAHQT